MNRTRRGQPRQVTRAGFTMTELLVASSIAALVVAGVLTTFIWGAQQAALCAKIAWSQTEAMNTSEKLLMYIRNATKIVSIDERQGTWVVIRFADGTTGKLVYSNAVPLLRDGRMFIEHTNRTQVLVARGLTEIQEAGGFTTPVFTRSRTNCLRVAYRVAEPAASGARDANDGPFAACVRFGACLRNAEQ